VNYTVPAIALSMVLFVRSVAKGCLTLGNAPREQGVTVTGNTLSARAIV
jgi:hypothetical protein